MICLVTIFIHLDLVWPFFLSSFLLCRSILLSSRFVGANLGSEVAPHVLQAFEEIKAPEQKGQISPFLANGPVTFGCSASCFTAATSPLLSLLELFTIASGLISTIPCCTSSATAVTGLSTLGSAAPGGADASYFFFGRQRTQQEKELDYYRDFFRRLALGRLFGVVLFLLSQRPIALTLCGTVSRAHHGATCGTSIGRRKNAGAKRTNLHLLGGRLVVGIVHILQLRLWLLHWLCSFLGGGVGLV